MRKLFILFTVFVFSLNCSYAQQQFTGIWNKLSDVAFKTIKYKGYEVDKPVFGKNVKAIAGKEITVKGYMIPLSDLNDQGYFVLSAFPYNLCYFCGNAGPETVMEVNMKKKIKYTSKPVVVKGKLQLNNIDYDALIYRLNDAILIN